MDRDAAAFNALSSIKMGAPSNSNSPESAKSGDCCIYSKQILSEVSIIKKELIMANSVLSAMLSNMNIVDDKKELIVANGILGAMLSEIKQINIRENSEEESKKEKESEKDSEKLSKSELSEMQRINARENSEEDSEEDSEKDSERLSNSERITENSETRLGAGVVGALGDTGMAKDIVNNPGKVAIAALVGAVTVGLIALVQNFDKIKIWLSELYETLKKNLLEAVSSIKDAISEWVGIAAKAISDGISGAVDWVIEYIKNKFSEWGNAISIVFDMFKDLIMKGIDPIRNFFTDMVTNFKNIILDVGDLISNIRSVLPERFGGISDAQAQQEKQERAKEREANIIVGENTKKGRAEEAAQRTSNIESREKEHLEKYGNTVGESITDAVTTALMVTGVGGVVGAGVKVARVASIASKVERGAAGVAESLAPAASRAPANVIPFPKAPVPAGSTVRVPAPAASSAPANSNYLGALAQIESSGNASARSKTSSAAGLYQFTEGTWKDTVKKMGKDYSLDDRFDPKKSAEVAEFFTAQNKKIVEKNIGRKTNDTDQYMAHFLGAGGASKFLSNMDKDGSASAAQLMGADAANANKNIFFDKGGKERSLQEVYGLMDKKVSSASASTMIAQNSMEKQVAMNTPPPAPIVNVHAPQINQTSSQTTQSGGGISTRQDDDTMSLMLRRSIG